MTILTKHVMMVKLMPYVLCTCWIHSYNVVASQLINCHLIPRGCITLETKVSNKNRSNSFLSLIDVITTYVITKPIRESWNECCRSGDRESVEQTKQKHGNFRYEVAYV